MPRGRWSSPRTRRPELPRWSGAECPECGLPGEWVVIDVNPELGDKGNRVLAERKISFREGKVAARIIGTGLHGYLITDLRPIRAGFQPLILHADVCAEASKPFEQQSLL